MNLLVDGHYSAHYTCAIKIIIIMPILKVHLLRQINIMF